MCVLHDILCYIVILISSCHSIYLKYLFFLMIRRPPRSTLDRSSAASDVYKRQQIWRISSAQYQIRVDGVFYSYKEAIMAARANPNGAVMKACLLYTSPSPRDRTRSRMPSSACKKKTKIQKKKKKQIKQKKKQRQHSKQQRLYIRSRSSHRR